MEGAWELCGEFQKSISCVIMSDTNYLDIFDDESVRVTTFRKLEIPDRIPDSLDTDSHGKLLYLFHPLIVVLRRWLVAAFPVPADFPAHFC